MSHMFAFYGVLTAVAVVVVACFVLVPRSVDSPPVSGVLTVAGLAALSGLALGFVPRARAFGLGAVGGAVLGVFLAWSALVIFLVAVVGP